MGPQLIVQFDSVANCTVKPIKTIGLSKSNKYNMLVVGWLTGFQSGGRHGVLSKLEVRWE